MLLQPAQLFPQQIRHRKSLLFEEITAVSSHDAVCVMCMFPHVSAVCSWLYLDLKQDTTDFFCQSEESRINRNYSCCYIIVRIYQGLNPSFYTVNGKMKSCMILIQFFRTSNLQHRLCSAVDMCLPSFNTNKVTLDLTSVLHFVMPGTGIIYLFS